MWKEPLESRWLRSTENTKNEMIGGTCWFVPWLVSQMMMILFEREGGLHTAVGMASTYPQLWMKRRNEGNTVESKLTLNSISSLSDSSSPSGGNLYMLMLLSAISFKIYKEKIGIEFVIMGWLNKYTAVYGNKRNNTGTLQPRKSHRRQTVKGTDQIAT